VQAPVGRGRGGVGGVMARGCGRTVGSLVLLGASPWRPAGCWLQRKQRAFEERNSFLADLSPTWPMSRVHITGTEKDGSRNRVFEINMDLEYQTI